MKYLSLLAFTVIMIMSCCGAKGIAQKDELKMDNGEVVIVTEVPDAIEGEVEIEAEEEFWTEVEEIPVEPEENGSVEAIDIKPLFTHDIWDKLLKKHVAIDGKVDYKGFKNDIKNLKEYIKLLSTNQPDDSSTKNEKLAFWINAYNALTIDLILRNYPIRSIKDVKDPWDQRLWKFGDKWQNLNDIEHEILRKMDEPRIHFAIVCASVSCPKLKNEAFTASNLDAQLTNATKEFLADNTRNEISKDELKLSKIFRWFKKDFEQNGSLIDFLNEYSDIAISQSAKVRYKDYDWDLNN